MNAASKSLCNTCFEAAVTGRTCTACKADQLEPNRDRRALPAGATVDGKYLIGRVLGSGGFGITYLAQDTQLARRVALKEFLPSGLGTRDVNGHDLGWNTSNDEAPFRRGLAKFYKEGQTLAKFNHHNIVHVHEVFSANGTAYLAMEYHEGMTLQDWLAQSPGKPAPGRNTGGLDTGNRSGRLEPAKALDVAVFVGEALAVVHAAGVVHRDLKPDNIYVTATGRILVLDFGGAKQIALETDKSMDLIFANGYAARELYQADPKKIGPWTDVYALAATLYKMLTGIKPLGALERLAEDQPLDWSGVKVSQAVKSAVTKAMMLNAADRYQSAQAFLKALEVGAPDRRGPAAWKLATGAALVLGVAATAVAINWPPGAPRGGPAVARPVLAVQASGAPPADAPASNGVPNSAPPDPTPAPAPTPAITPADTSPLTPGGAAASPEVPAAPTASSAQGGKRKRPATPQAPPDANPQSDAPRTKPQRDEPLSDKF